MDNTVNISGVEIEYHRSGSGPVLVFLPGTLGDHHILSSIRQYLQNEIIVINHPPVGDFDELIMIYHDFFMKIGLSEFHIAGTSVGGWIALHYTKKFPEHIISIISANSFSDNSLLREANSKIFRVFGFIPWFLIKRMFRSNVKKSVERFENGDHALSYLSKSLDAMGKKALHTRLSWSLIDTEAIRLGNVPMLVIYTRDDSVVSYSNTELLVNSHTHAKVVELSTGDHYPYLLNAEEYSGRINDFLQSQ